MKANNYISNKELRLIQVVAFIWVILVVSNFCSEVINTYNDAVSEQQKELATQAGSNVIRFSGCFPCCSMPGFHFVSIFIFIALIKPKRFITSLLLTFSYLSMEFYFIHKIYYCFGNFDVLASVFILVLLFWQISILFRILIKSLQRKSELP